eukprot:472360_1
MMDWTTAIITHQSLIFKHYNKMLLKTKCGLYRKIHRKINPLSHNIGKRFQKQYYYYINDKLKSLHILIKTLLALFTIILFYVCYYYCFQSNNINYVSNDTTIKLQKQPAQIPSIPKHIYLTYSFDIFQYDSNNSDIINQFKDTQENIIALKKNIQKIKTLNPTFTIHFFNDTECIKFLRNYSNEIAEYFINEKRGMFKADLFRIVILYLLGGYYMDVDLEPRFGFAELIQMGTEFATVTKKDDENNIFNAFIATVPKHPILDINLKYYLEFYRGQRKLQDDAFIGTVLLAESVKTWSRMSIAILMSSDVIRKGKKLQLFEECEPKIGTEPCLQLLRKDTERIYHRGYMEKCFVYDPNVENKEILFWSRVVNYQNAILRGEW